MTITYNPVVKNGKFECVGFGKRFAFRGIDIIEVKYKFVKKFKLIYSSDTFAKIEVTELEPTIRVNDLLKGAK